MSEDQKVTVKLTVRELQELQVSAISMHMSLCRDRHAKAEDRDFWFNLQDKLLLAMIRSPRE